ncbi:unnamed protein product, partial [Mesorhabditis spiculigera]
MWLVLFVFIAAFTEQTIALPVDESFRAVSCAQWAKNNKTGLPKDDSIADYCKKLCPPPDWSVKKEEWNGCTPVPPCTDEHQVDDGELGYCYPNCSAAISLRKDDTFELRLCIRLPSCEAVKQKDLCVHYGQPCKPGMSSKTHYCTDHRQMWVPHEMTSKETSDKIVYTIVYLSIGFWVTVAVFGLCGSHLESLARETLIQNMPEKQKAINVREDFFQKPRQRYPYAGKRLHGRRRYPYPHVRPSSSDEKGVDNYPKPDRKKED